MKRPDQYMCWLFDDLNAEMEKRAPELCDAERAILITRFIDRFDFENTASAHKSAGGIAELILSEYGIYNLIEKEEREIENVEMCEAIKKKYEIIRNQVASEYEPIVAK